MDYSAWPGLASHLTLADLEALERLAPKDWDLDALLGFISSESGFRNDAEAYAGTGTGYIQMSDAVARIYGGVSYARELKRQCWQEQLPGIIKYFSCGRPMRGADFKLLGFSRNPELLDAPDSRVMYAAGSRAAALHKAFQDASGAMTVGTIRAWWDAYVAKTAKAKLDPAKLRAETVCRKPFSAGGPLLLAGAAAFAYFVKRKR